MRDDTTLALRPDLFGQLAATDPFQGRARRLYERGQVLAVNGNQADVRVGYDARNNPLDLKEVPIVSGYIPRVGDWVAIQYEAGHSGAPWVAGPSMAADESEDTPGIGVFSVSSEEPADPQKSTVYFHEPASTWRGWNGAAWVDLGGGGGGGLHNALPDLQGGAAGEYYHLTAAHWSALVGKMPFGAGGVLYADAAGKLQTDAANLLWDAANTQLVLAVGSAAKPAYTFAGRRTDGLFSLGAGGLGLTTSGVLRIQVADTMTFFHDQQVRLRSSAAGTRTLLLGVDEANSVTYLDSTYGSISVYPLAFRLGGVQRMGLSTDGLGIGVDPTGKGRRLYVYDSVAGDVSHVYQNASTDAAAGYYIYLLTAGGGDIYHRYACPGSQWWAYGVRQSDDKWVWSNYFDLSTAPATYDRMTLDRNGVVWWKPHSSPALAADGEAAMDSTERAWLTRIGGVTRKMRGQRHIRKAVAEVKSTTSETTVDTIAIGADSWGEGKPLIISLGGQGYAASAVSGRFVTLRVKLGSTTLLEWKVVFVPASAGQQSLTDWGCIGVIVPHARGSNATVSWYFLTDVADVQGTTPGSKPTKIAGTATFNTTSSLNITTTLQPSVSDSQVGSTLFGTKLDES